MIDIHATAVIHPSAKIGQDVKIGPYVVIGEHCTIGDGTILGPHSVIEPFTILGKECQVFSGAVVGAIPQDVKYGGEESYTFIGDRNVIRECVTINRATGMGEETRIGDDNLFLAYVHIAHNCMIGNGCILSNAVTLAGHVELEDFVTIGGMTGVHQFTKIGTMAMVGAMARIVQDVPPYMLVEGNPPKAYGPNVIGLKRRGMDQETRTLLKRAYKLIYRSNLNVAQAIEKIIELGDASELHHLIHFIERSERGLVGKLSAEA